MAVYKSKNLTKDGRQYFFRIKYKDIFGEWHDYTSPKFKNQKEAKEEEARYRIKISENKVSTANVTFKEIYSEYISEKKKRVKPQTINREEVFFRHLKSLHNEKINSFDLTKYKKFNQFVSDLPFEADYKNKILGLLKRLITYSKKYYNTSDNINSFIENFKETNKIKKEMDFFTYEEYKQFDKVITDFKYHTFFETLYFLGIRQGECQALTWNDIDFENNKLHITKTLTTKIKGEKWTISSPKTRNSIRILPIPEKLLNDLKTMYNEARKYSDFTANWFVFGNSEPFKETTIQKKKNNYCDLAKVKQIRIHDFRHSCASLLINKGASITLVSKYLGHSNISITLDVYSHMYQSELSKMTEILNKL